MITPRSRPRHDPRPYPVSGFDLGFTLHFFSDGDPRYVECGRCGWEVDAGDMRRLAGELIYQLGDERDEARDAIARLREVAKKADALLHDLRMASSRDDVWVVVAYDRVERAHKALAREVGP